MFLVMEVTITPLISQLNLIKWEAITMIYCGIKIFYTLLHLSFN